MATTMKGPGAEKMDGKWRINGEIVLPSADLSIFRVLVRTHVCHNVIVVFMFIFPCIFLKMIALFKIFN